MELRCKDSMPKMFTPTMNLKLTQCISSEELHVVAKSVARGQMEQSRSFIYFLGDNRIKTCKMVNATLEVGHFPEGMNKGLITLLLKA